MKKSVLLFVIMLFFLSVDAQERKWPDRMTNLTNSADLFVGFWQDVDLQIVDTTIVEVIYDLKYRQETISGNYLEMLTVLQIGRMKSKYYSIIRQLTDDIQIDVRNRIKKLPVMPGIGVQHEYTEEERRIIANAGVDRLNSEIWVDSPTQTLTERTHDYARSNLSIEYQEPTPIFEWRSTTQKDTICGYPCFVATAKFRGREWTVWYTSEIPISAGPWKFNGLPGLILRAYDAQQDYCWECRSILQKIEPIVYYKVACKLLSIDKWRQYIRQIHEIPLQALGENGNREFYVKGKLVTEDDAWTIPYNPIELE